MQVAELALKELRSKYDKAKNNLKKCEGEKGDLISKQHELLGQQKNELKAKLKEQHATKLNLAINELEAKNHAELMKSVEKFQRKATEYENQIQDQICDIRELQSHLSQSD